MFIVNRWAGTGLDLGFWVCNREDVGVMLVVIEKYT